jgi:hypothetical protein
MKSIFQRAGSLVFALVAATALTGCAAMQDEHLQHHPAAASATSPGGMGQGGPAGQMGMMSGADGQMDMKSMCEMHNKMMGSKTPEQQKAMMDDHMKSMSPEMKQHHMDMMKQCK